MNTTRIPDTWSAEDAASSVAMEDSDGHLWKVAAVGWDGTVHVVSSRTIAPDERTGWTAHKLPDPEPR